MIAVLALTTLAGKNEQPARTVTVTDQRKAEYIFMQANNEKIKDNFDAFHDLLAHAHEIDPGNTAVSFYLGMCMLRMNNTTAERCEQGLALMKEHFDAHPQDLYETTFYSDANMQLGHPDEALRAIKALNEHNPNKLELQVRLADAYAQSGDYASSNATYDSIEAIFGNAIQITTSKIENFMAMNDSTGALREMRRLLATAPHNDSYNLAMSSLFQHYGMSDSAFYYLDRAQEYAPDNGIIYLTRAELYSQAGDSAGYEQQIYNALTAEQLDVDTKLGVLLTYIRGKVAEQDTTQRIDGLFTVLIEQHPHEASIHQLYSEYLYTKKDYKGAIEQLGYSLDVNPTDASSWRNMVILNMMDDNYPAAIKASEKAIEYNPDNMDLQRYVAGCYHQMKQYDKAIEAYRKLLALTDSTDVTTRAEIITGMGDSAFYYLDRAQEYAPDNGIIYLTRAELYSQAGDSAGYEQQIYNALTAEQLDVDTKLGVLLTYIRGKVAEQDTTQRIDGLFTVLIEQHPHEASIHQLYSEYLYTKKDYKGAIEQLGYSLDVNPTDASSWRNMVILNMMDDNYPAAIKASEKAIEYNPDNMDLQRYVAGCYHQMKQYDKAIEAYRKLLALTDSTDVTTRAEIITGMGDTYSEIGDTVKTVECYEQALEIDPLNSSALNNYAYFLAQRGQDLDRAERMAARAVKNEPDNANFIDTYAWVYFAKKEYTKALIYIISAVEKDEDNHLLEHYGDILWFNDERESAIEQWNKALEQDPDNELLQRKVKDKTYYEK